MHACNAEPLKPKLLSSQDVLHVQICGGLRGLPHRPGIICRGAAGRAAAARQNARAGCYRRAAGVFPPFVSYTALLPPQLALMHDTLRC